jgi:shikimate 5-dehydrogenase
VSQKAMGFVGVDTAHSSIMRVFPLWAEHLHLPTRLLRGHDIPLESPDAVYRDLVTSIAQDQNHLGALVTTHKIRLYEAAHDLFDDLDDFSRQCGEISSISKRHGRLRGAAKDPVTAGLAIAEILPAGWFRRTGGEVLCLGSGGAGTAISTHLGGTDHRHGDRTPGVTLTDVSSKRLAHVRDVHTRAGLDPSLFRYVLVTSADQAREVVAASPPHSLVVNATGLGKDRPGSPVPDDTVFPRGAVVWEINYRGPLGFLRLAQRQQQARGLLVADGWRYFIHGWTQVIAEVFDISMPADTVEELAALAGQLAPDHPPSLPQ